MGRIIISRNGKILGFKCASYRACKLGNTIAVITQSIVKDNEKLILGTKIIEDFINAYPNYEDEMFNNIYDISNNNDNNNKYLLNYLNNLDHLWSIFSLRDDISEEEIGDIINFLLDQLIFDIITLQGDRHLNNWSVIYDNSVYKTSKFFDNSTSFGLSYPDMLKRISDFLSTLSSSKFTRNKSYVNELIYMAYPSLTLTSSNIIDSKSKDSALKVLKDFLNMTDDNTNMKYSKLIAQLNSDVFDNMIQSAEKNNGLVMKPEVYQYITSLFNEHLSNLKNVLKEYWIEKKHHKNK